jgi:hypothetical protein
VYKYTRAVCVSVGSAKSINRLSLVGMQLPEKYKDNFNVLIQGPSNGVTSDSRRRAFAPNVEILLIFLR